MPDADLESEIVAFLGELSSAQTEMLKLLVEKRECLVKYDGPGLAAIVPREEQLVARLQSCLDRRAELLARADEKGLPHESLRDLAGSLADGKRSPLAKSVQQASSQARILQHNSLTNWVLVQRTLIHLSQMLEIIATGGRPQPTYGKGDAATSSGALVDQAA
jgi:flagellar biosynthesis/type III secretory pathway chaperone